MGDVKEQCDDTKTDVPSGSSVQDLTKSLSEEAFNNFLQGKRHMLVKDYQFAVQSLSTACELYVKHYGEMAIECGDVYLLYGKALFHLSQQQSGFFGDALNEGGSEEDEGSSGSDSKGNESEKNSDQEQDGGGDNNETEEVDTEEKEPSESTDSPQAVVDEANGEGKTKEDVSLKPSEDVKVDESKDEPVESKVADGQVISSGENKVEEPAAENQEAEENQETEEGDLELAWNILETAKTIFTRQSTVESELKVAEILQVLAQVSLETDKNAAAIEDLKKCLEIQKKHLKPDDRLLAETYYQMGLAQLLDKQYHDALDNFGTTKSILELHLENLRNTPVDESAGSFASADKDVEISDLENILLDIQEKIEDTEELLRAAKKELKEAFGLATLASPVKDAGESSSGIKPVSNISHLMKRKASPVKDAGESSSGIKPVSNISHLMKRKKPDEESSEGEPKRIKLTSIPNGESKGTPSPEPVTTTKG